MNIGALAIKFLNAIVSLFPSASLDEIPVIENIVEVTNFFAWANFFLPSGVILILLTITASIYVFRGFYNILKDFIF